MRADELGTSIAHAVGRAVNVPGIDVQDIILRSPDGPMVAPISPRFGVDETPSQEA